jgi:hypothetical protein
MPAATGLLVTDLPPKLHLISDEALAAYCQGALRDGTYSARHRTHRIGQADAAWLRFLADILERLGRRSWIYREGRDRRLWVLETTAPFLSLSFDPRALAGRPEGVHYARGYFDADGGMPRDVGARLYFQFVQKDISSLQGVSEILRAAGIGCGRIHNPSRAADPHYWRFFVSAASHRQFMRLVGSWHPRKRLQIADRVGRS